MQKAVRIVCDTAQRAALMGAGNTLHCCKVGRQALLRAAIHIIQVTS